MYAQGLRGSTYNNQKAAMVMYFRAAKAPTDVLEHPLVGSTIQACIKNRPPQPANEEAFPLDTLMDLMCEWGSVQTITTLQLRLRVIVLLRVCALLRSSDVACVVTDRVQFLEDGTASFVLLNPKTTSGYSTRRILHPLPEEPRLCPVRNLREYLSRTQQARAVIEGHPLILDDALRAGIGAQRIAKLALQCMREAGIEDFPAHALRMASATRLVDSGVSVDEVMVKGDWTSRETFNKFYLRAFQRNNRNSLLLRRTGQENNGDRSEGAAQVSGSTSATTTTTTQTAVPVGDAGHEEDEKEVTSKKM